MSILGDIHGAEEVRGAIDFASDCAGIIAHTFRRTFGGQGKAERHVALRRRMEDAHWAGLADPFRGFVLAAATPKARERARRAWLDRVVDEGNTMFKTYSEMTGSDATSLRERVTGRRICGIRLNTRRRQALGL